MKGRINYYNPDKGFGFIIGENEENYFFHISNIVSLKKPELNAIVDFEEGQNEKGKCALKVKIQKDNTLSPFISFGDKQIKASNIKDYGLSEYEVYYQKVNRIKGKVKHNVAKTAIDLTFFLVGGIASGYSGYETRWEGDKIRLTPEEAERLLDGHRARRFFNSDGVIVKSDSVADKDQLITEIHKYLYVTTYQNDNYRFYELDCEFDVTEKYKEINNYFLK